MKSHPNHSDQLIMNRNGGKLHRALVFDSDMHPREWRTRCAWHFGGPHTLFEAIQKEPDEPSYCLKRFPEHRKHNNSSASESSDSESTSSA